MLAKTYGWTHRQILDLTVKQFWAYAHEAKLLAAESQLMALEATSFPKMTMANKNKVHFSYVKILQSDQTEAEKKRERKSQFKRLKARGLVHR